MTLSSIWFGLKALKTKQRTGPDRSFVNIAPSVALILSGVFTQIVGYKLGNMLLILFPFLGHIIASQQIKYWAEIPREKRHWWYAHMQGMGTACIATVTAFIVTAVPRFVDSSLFQSPILWIAPGLIGGIALSYYTKEARAKFEK